MLSRSLFISYSTPNYDRLTQIYLNSLREIGIREEQIDHFLDEEVIQSEGGFQSDLWYQAVEKKIRHLIHSLQREKDLDPKYNYFIFNDCDILYLKENLKEWALLEEFIRNSDRDIFFMREGNTDDVNSGFFVIKRNERLSSLIHFFEDVLAKMGRMKRKEMPFGDQTIINQCRDDGRLRYDYLPNEYLIFGRYVYNAKKSLFHHAVGCSGVEEKIHQILMVKSYFQQRLFLSTMPKERR